MGYNFSIVCHKCKERAFALRESTREVLFNFVRKHQQCGKENKSNVEIGYEIWNDVYYNNKDYTDISKEMHPEDKHYLFRD